MRKAVVILPISKALLLPAKILPPTIKVLEAFKLPETLSDEPIEDEALEMKPASVESPKACNVPEALVLPEESM